MSLRTTTPRARPPASGKYRIPPPRPRTPWPGAALARLGHSPAGRGDEPAGRWLRCRAARRGRRPIARSGPEGVRVELAAGGDAEFGVGLVQVVAHRPRAEEQLGGDVAVGQSLRGEPGDLQLLRGQAGKTGPG